MLIFGVSLSPYTAQAAPAFLGPNGVQYLGPLPPQQQPYQDVVLVDPLTGGLWIEHEDFAGGKRIWNGERWKIPSNVPEGVLYEFVDERYVRSLHTLVFSSLQPIRDCSSCPLRLLRSS